MPGPILFKLGMLVVHGGLLMHVIFFRDLIQNGRLAAILFFVFVLLECFFNKTCIKVVTEKNHDNIHVHVKFFFDPVIFSRLGVILVPKMTQNRIFDMSSTVFRRCLGRFCSNLVCWLYMVGY